MEFSILGPLTVHVDGAEVAPKAGKPRALLVRLLVAGGRAVAADRLIEDLWDGDPPRSGRQTLQTYVLQLRKQIGSDRLVTAGGGYRVVVFDGELDTERFEERLTAGRRALDEGAAPEAIVAFEQALQWWRGEPLADAAGAGWAIGEAARLEELRLVALEQLLEAHLAVGANAEAVVIAESAVAEHPLRERLWSHLITALYRQGRQADALRAFQRLRRQLADELGIDPSPELGALEQALLEQNPRLALAADARQPQQSALPSGLVTFLLTDVAGSTRLWDTLPQVMPDALALHDHAIRVAVESHRGVVLKARGEGDSAFAVFRRATDGAAAAVTAQRALAASDWPQGCALSVRMAVHTGEALERDGDYYGPTVNRAARLRANAEGGQILVSRATADVIVDHLGPELHLVELGRQQLRDLERPETVYLLVDDDAPSAPVDPTAASEPSPLDLPPMPSALTPSGPFIGREAEIERLAAEWERVQQGTPRVVMLGGEPGVGKTRLAAAMAERAHADGAIVLYGRCDEDLGGPYQPFAEASRLLLSALDVRRLRAVRGVEELLRLVPEVADIVSDLRAPTHSDPDTERYALFDTVARLLVAVSKERPILLVLDDLQWAAKPTLLMLRHILRFGEGAAVELLGTYRTTDLDPAHPLAGTLADLHRDGTIERVMLDGLDEHHVSAFLAATGREDEELAKTLASVTSGNPFFLIEVLRHVDDNGGRWDPNTLPQGVREAVGRRLARLGDQTRDALLAGAVAGPRFALDVIEQVLDRDLVDAVAEACAAGILVEEPGGYFQFSHALVRQSLLTGVASVKRVRLHQRVAETLEAAGADRGEPLADLAHHYFESAWAGNAAKAVEYCRRAANQAMDGLAYEGAAELFDRALQALEIDERADRAAIRAELMLARCEALLAAGDTTAATAAVADLEAVASGSRRLSAWVACFTAEIAALTRPDQLEAMERRVAAAADEFAALDDTAGETVAHNTRASCLARLGRFAECELALDRALTAARRSTSSATSPTSSDHRRVNAVLGGAPVAALWGPNPVARAGGRCLDVIRLLRITTGSSPAVEATSVRCQAVLEAFRGRTRAARRMLDRARRSLAELGLRHALLEVDLYAGIVELIADDAEAAAAPLRRAYDGFRKMGFDAGAAEAAALLARASFHLGRHEAADQLCAESERLAGQDLRSSIAWRTVRAELLAHGRDHERARQIAEAAVALAAPTDALVDHGDARLALARVLDAAGDQQGAADAAEEAVRLYEQKGATALTTRARQLVGVSLVPAREEDGTGGALSWLASGAFTAPFRYLLDIFRRQAWGELAAVVHPDVVFENRARLPTEPILTGIDAYVALVRSNAEIGHGSPRIRFIASRGPRLALVHMTTVIEDGGSDWSDEAVRVLQLDTDGRLLADIVFDVGDHDVAYAELDARYVEDMAIAEANVFRTIVAAVDAYNRRVPTSAPTSPDLETIDHRPHFAGVEGGRVLWSDFQGAIAQAPDSTMRLVAVHALGAGGAVVTTAQHGTTEGGAVEAVFHGVHLVDDGSMTRIELFPESELDRALARFAELTGEVPVARVRENRSPVEAPAGGYAVADNTATIAHARYHAACASRDWATVETLLADDIVADDRGQLLWHGRDAVIDAMRGAADLGVERYDCTTIATRGRRLGLVHVRGSGHDQAPGAPALEVLAVVEVDREGRIARSRVVEVDDVDAAYAELDSRYVAGEGAPYADTIGLVLEGIRAQSRDWERTTGLYADGMTFVDHRPAAFGVLVGPTVRDVIPRQWADDVHALEIEAVADGIALVLVHAREASPEAVEAEWVFRVLNRVEGGLVTRIELFDADDRAAALAAFEDLRPPANGSLVVENRAAATLSRFLSACLRSDWVTAELVYAATAVGQDRRAGVRTRTDGRAPNVADFRFGVEMGVTRYDATTIATRGDRILLTRLWCGTDQLGSAVVELLFVVETDAAGCIDTTVAFDLDDVDAAYAEIDARYAVGEAAPFAETWAVIVDAYSRFNAGRGELRWPGAQVEVTAFADVPGLQARVTAVHRLAEDVALLSVSASAPGTDSWEWLVVFRVSDGRTGGIETYTAADFEVALARFDKLARST